MGRSPLLVVVVTAALWTGLGAAVATPALASSPPRTLVVDDDRAQCNPRAYPNIQSAVTAARRGDTIRICPGRYAERVVVDKTLSLVGEPAAVAALDCFAEQPSDAAAVDITRVPLLEPPDAEETPVLTVSADRVEVAGLVVQGVDDEVSDVVGDGYELFDAALTTDDEHTGWRFHHNLFQLNVLAVELGSRGGPTSRFDHNCLRDNVFAVANQRYALSHAVLDHNETYRSDATGWELGWGYRGIDAVTFEHNTSRRDGRAVTVENADRPIVADNVVEQARIGITVAGGVDRGRILANTVTGTTAGPAVGVTPAAGAEPVTGLVVRGNTLTDNGLSGFTTGGSANLTGATIMANTVSRNQRSGILLAPGSHDNVLRGNVTESNAQYGIRLFAGTEDNRLVGNRMLGNVLADAVDETAVTSDGSTVLANSWRRSTCLVDVPAGSIC